MSNLSSTEKELILEYCLGVCGSSDARRAAEELIAHNAEAARIGARLTTVLGPLAGLTAECPDELASRAVEGLCALAAEAEQAATPVPQVIRLGRFRHFSNVAAVVTIAACIVLILATAIPSFSFIRQRYYRQVCLDQLREIFGSFSLYSSDHDGLLPAVQHVAGAPWHGIGSQGPEGYSNTRNLYLLVKGGYSEPAEFICCGRTKSRATGRPPATWAELDDFSSRDGVTYSYRLISQPRTQMSSLAAQPLMADMNPHFEDLSPAMAVCPSDDALRLNSRNHRRQGQNVLWGDGHVRFSSVRTVGANADDIYTIADTSTYHGVEWPRGPNDTFIAP